MIEPLIIEDEIKDLSELQKKLIRDKGNKFKNEFKKSIKLSFNYCTGCVNAYKSVCGDIEKDVYYDYEEVIDKQLLYKSIRNEAIKNSFTNNLFKSACADMRMIQTQSCNFTDSGHSVQIESKLKK